MQQLEFKYGLGIDENTAMVVANGSVTIIGYRGAIFCNCAQAKRDAKPTGFQWRGIKLTYLDRGDRLNLTTLEVTPSAEKLAGEKVDPSSAGFDPGSEKPLFTSDILGNTTLLDVMERLMNSRDAEGFGLAFDGHAAQHAATPGYEFRFYRGPGTLSWSTGVFGDGSATVQNIYLDIRPVQVGPLYPPPKVAALPKSKLATASRATSRAGFAPQPIRRLLSRRW
jgi:cyanophycinase